MNSWFAFTTIATYAKWTPGNPSTFSRQVPCCSYLHLPYTACGNGSACSSGKVAGLIFFEVFAYLWASQVIGNVSLATLAGGPYGSKCLRQHAIYLLKFCRLVLLWTKGTRSNAKTPYSICSRTRIDPLPWIYRLWVADRDITRHYEDDLTSCKAKREC